MSWLLTGAGLMLFGIVIGYCLGVGKKEDSDA